MNLVLIGGATLLGLYLAYRYFLKRFTVKQIARYARYGVGGLMAVVTGLLLLRGQVGPASITGYLAFLIIKNGRIGGFSFEDDTFGEDNESAVKARYLTMTLDHDTGEVNGRVTAGRFRGRDLLSLSEGEMQGLLTEVVVDPDSLALLETWLDKNREGWRERFTSASGGGAGAGQGQSTATPVVDADAEAYEVLGLRPGATADEIRAAHHKLMKGVHPDQGGSNYLAQKINAAKDRLLKKAKTR